ncbi:MAG: hypothetical protein ACJAZM_000778 [Cyclobacteriaceae bacterium]|jgi:hypothetical protein
MKSLKNGFLAVIVAIFALTSCIEDTVAPEVEALRQAQINYLNSQIAYQDAITRLALAEAVEQEILNDFTTAMNALDLQMQDLALRLEQARTTEREAYYAAQLVYWEAQTANYRTSLRYAEAALQTAELALRNAVRDLERWIATDSTSDASYYLSLYETAMTDVYSLAGDIVSIQNDIAIMQIGESGSSGNTIAYLLLKAQNEATFEVAEIVDLQDAITLLEAILADPTSVQAAVDSLADDIYATERTVEQLDAAAIRATDADSVAELAYNAQADAIDDYEAAVDSVEIVTVAITTTRANIVTEEDNITTAEESITASETEITTLEAELAVEETKLTAENTILTSLNTILDTEQTKLDNLQDDVDDAQAKVDSAQTAFNIADAKHQVFIDLFNSGDTDLYTAVDSTTAGNAENLALATLSDANSDLADATLLKNGQDAVVTAAQTAVTAQETAVTTQETAVAAVETNIETEETNITTQETALATAKEAKRQFEQQLVFDRSDSTSAQATVTVLQADFDAAIGGALATALTDWNTALTATDAADLALASAERELAILNDLYDLLDADANEVADAFDAELGSSLEDAISALEDDIVTAQDALNAATVDIATYSADDLDLQAMIVDLQTELAELQTRLVSLQALAAEYKALLDAALGQ